jgi:hypothetical protein
MAWEFKHVGGLCFLQLFHAVATYTSAALSQVSACATLQDTGVFPFIQCILVNEAHTQLYGRFRHGTLAYLLS